MINTDIDRLLNGSIDMHLHCGPDEMRYRLDALEAAEQAAEAGMRAIVLKNHSIPTTPLASTIGPLVPDIEVFGSVCLDYEIGGLNLDALQKHARLGARVVWMPTFSSTNSRDKMRALGLALEGAGFSILNAEGKMVPEIAGILSIIKEYDIDRDKFPSNWELSAARAAAVVRFFQYNSGLDPKNLEAVGRSFYDSVASNETKEGRAQNRRVNIIIGPKLE